jgi:predicted site-specific integrase-resolvase
VRVAIYARVSTDDKGQDPENQLRELRDWANHASTGTAFGDQGSKALSTLGARLSNKLRQLGDVRRNPPRLILAE